MKKAAIIIISLLVVAFFSWKAGFGILWGHLLSSMINLFSFNPDISCSIITPEGKSVMQYMINGNRYFQVMEDFAFSALALICWQIFLVFFLSGKKWLISFLTNIPVIILLQSLFIGLCLPLSKQSVGWLDFYITVLPNFIILVFFLILKDLAIFRPGVLQKK